LGSAQVVTTWNMEGGRWNVGWCINVKSKDWYVIFSQIVWKLERVNGMEKKECSGIACWEGIHCVEYKKMCRWMCMAKTLQWECDGEIPITMSINTLKHIEIHWNIL
jgi:hypothetical protein